MPENGITRSWSPLHSQYTTKHDVHGWRFRIAYVNLRDRCSYWNIMLSPVYQSAVTPGGEVEVVLYAARNIVGVGKTWTLAPNPFLHCSLFINAILLSVESQSQEIQKRVISSWKVNRELISTDSLVLQSEQAGGGNLCSDEWRVQTKGLEAKDKEVLYLLDPKGSSSGIVICPKVRQVVAVFLGSKEAISGNGLWWTAEINIFITLI